MIIDDKWWKMDPMWSLRNSCNSDINSAKKAAKWTDHGNWLMDETVELDLGVKAWAKWTILSICYDDIGWLKW